MPRPLSDKQCTFSRLIARGELKPAECYRRAGFTGKPRREVHRLMRNPRILAAIETTERRIYAGKLASIRAKLDQLSAKFRKPHPWQT